MKKLLLLALGLIMSAMTFAQDTDHALAMVQKTQGLLVFTDSEPVCKYDILSREKVAFALSGDYSNIKNKLIKKALKDFPDADGIVLELSNTHADNAVIIKFVSDPNVPTTDYPKARVTKQSGLYVFTECEPVCKYSIVDRQKVRITMSGQYTEIRDKLIKKTVKDTPNADGVILGDDVHCVIKFE